MAIRAVLAAILLVLLAGCGDDTGAGGPTPDEETSMTPSDARITAAIDDLAAREDVDPSDVRVAEWGGVTWSDSSLGCPEPGMSYMQVLTDGYLLVLEVDGKRFEYHGNARGGPLRYCANPKAPAERAE